MHAVPVFAALRLRLSALDFCRLVDFCRYATSPTTPVGQMIMHGSFLSASTLPLATTLR